jgi:hypothetical protein
MSLSRPKKRRELDTIEIRQTRKTEYRTIDERNKSGKEEGARERERKKEKRDKEQERSDKTRQERHKREGASVNRTGVYA